MAEEIIKARLWTKVDTLENWNNNPLLLGPGELALVTNGQGVPMNMKWGDKTTRKRFSDLPFAISYDQGQFVAITGTVLPASTAGKVRYSLVGEGTYTRSGMTSITVPAGKMGIIVDDGTTWTLVSTVTLPKGADGDSILPVFNPSKPGGYPKDAQVFYNGASYVSQKDSNTDTITDKNSWKLQSLSPIFNTYWKCKRFNLNNGTGLVTGKYLDDNGVITTGVGGYIVIPITPNLIGKPIYIDGFTLSQFVSGVGIGNFAFYNDSDNIVENGGVAFYGRYKIIPSGATKLLISVSRLVAPTQAIVDAIKVSVSFNRINENGEDCYITDINTIANAVPSTNLLHNFMAFGRGRRTVVNLTNPTDFYAYQHLDTQIVEVTPKDSVLWVYKLTNNLNAYGVVFYDKDWNVITNSDTIITTSIPNISDPSTINVNYNSVDETIYETPFLIPANCRRVVFGIMTNVPLSSRYQALTAISNKRLVASDFPIVNFNYNIEYYNDVVSYTNKFDLGREEEFLNMASLSVLNNGKFDASGNEVTGGQNVTFNVKAGEVYTVILTLNVTSSSEIGFGIYTDNNNVKRPLNLSNYSRVVIGNSGDTWGQPIRVYQIIPQSDWKSVSVTTTASQINRYFAIFKGSYDGSYLPFLNERVSKESIRLSSKKLQSINASCVGDSLTYQMMWQRYITFKTGISFDFNEIRFGKNGRRPTAVGGSMIYPEVTTGSNPVVPNPSTNTSITCRADDVMYYNPKMIFLMGGRNDLGKNIVIGDASNPPLLDYNNPPMTTGIAYSASNPNDTTGAMKTGLSFASCYRGILIKWLQNIPDAKIICLTVWGGNDGPRNQKEIKLIRQVILDICLDYGIQVIDTGAGGQINSINYTFFAPDGVHINDAGGIRESNYIIPFLT